MCEIKMLRINLVKLLEENYYKAHPYSGEYWMGVADFINDKLLNNAPINWADHPAWKIFQSSDKR